MRLAAGDVLLADEPLPAQHGFPVRLAVPGYYRANSVKWLWRLELAEHRAAGPFATTFYNDPAAAEDIAAGLAAQRPVWAIAPEAVIVAPAPDMVIRAGEPIEIWGWAWSFRGIAAAEVSIDGGKSFTQATLEPRRGWARQRFAFMAAGEARRGATLRPCDRGERHVSRAQVRAMRSTRSASP